MHERMSMGDMHLRIRAQTKAAEGECIYIVVSLVSNSPCFKECCVRYSMLNPVMRATVDPAVSPSWSEARPRQKLYM